jgi:monoamine oxidase
MLDTLIIGAGAAGIAAARHLYDAGQQILVLEARNRIGGRIWTDTQWAEFPIELGAEFIHGERAVTHALVRAAGLTTLAAPRYPTLRWRDGGVARPRDQWPPALRHLIDGLFASHHHLAERWPALTDADCSLADYLRGRGFTGNAIEMADVLLAQTCCASVETLSCADLARELCADHAGLEETHLCEGYAALLAWYSHDLPIRLNTPVHTIRWGAQGVTVLTTHGPFQARKCVVTLPVSLLQQGVIRFDPPLRRAKEQAIQALRMEPATKLLYRFSEPLWDEELLFMAHTGVAARWWTPGYGRPDAAVITAYVTAARARQVDSLPEAQALALGLAELEQLLGLSDIKKVCLAARRVSWFNEPYTRGGYAHVPPHAATARPILAQPEGDQLFFAGEATVYESNPQTVHGAIESGWRAAGEVCA